VSLLYSVNYPTSAENVVDPLYVQLLATFLLPILVTDLTKEHFRLYPRQYGRVRNDVRTAEPNYGDGCRTSRGIPAN
jgi:hypothetical protein